jgi:hypothetical protein
MAGDGLKLRARDPADLEVLSACLQDAIVPIGDMAFEPAARRFVMVANRFCWERADQVGDEPFDRVNCGVMFEGVNTVKLRRIDQGDRSLLLNLLAIRAEPRPAGAAITLVCAGDRDIRLETDGIAARLEDVDRPWPTRNRPAHALDGSP